MYVNLNKNVLYLIKIKNNMSFWNSFLRETGKNSGKWLSNKIFKEGWSNPYRFNSGLHFFVPKKN